jgi:hypothetical protein
MSSKPIACANAAPKLDLPQPATPMTTNELFESIVLVKIALSLGVKKAGPSGPA